MTTYVYVFWLQLGIFNIHCRSLMSIPTSFGCDEMRRKHLRAVQRTPLNRATSGPTLYVCNKLLELLSGWLI